jgi:hypothetical protein
MARQLESRSLSTKAYPADIVLAREWWHAHTGITFDRDFFFQPTRRLEDETCMEQVLLERCGDHEMGSTTVRPEAGPVHLATVSDDQVHAVFATVEQLREEACMHG